MRLLKTAEAHAEARWSFAEVRRELVDTLLHVRALSLDVVEGIERWRMGSRGNGTWPDPVTGESYLLKMKADTLWLSDSPLAEVLAFSSKSDPFFVVPSARERPEAPSNMMTPTLKARTQHQSGEQRKATLPLQNSLLRRIREAELVILKESVLARMQQQAHPGVRPASAGGWGGAADRGARPLTPEDSNALAPRRPAPLVLEGFISAQSAAQMAEDMLSGKVQRPAAADQNVLVAQALPGSWAQLGPPPRPPLHLESAAVFQLQPVGASAAEIAGVFERYIARVDPRLAGSVDGWKALGKLVGDEGPGALEWFWLRRTTASAAAEPDGLVVFRLKRMSTVICQLLHVTVVDINDLGEALDSVMTHMFTCLPVGAIRATLWYIGEGEEYAIFKDVEKVFKNRYFKWFQLCNESGVRGQVMNRPRSEQPDGPDPLTCAELPCVQVCAGQVWLCGGTPPPAAAVEIQASGSAQNITLAAVCLHELWKRSEKKAAADVVAANAAKAAETARGAAREGILHALLSGRLQRHLVRCQPLDLRHPEELNGDFSNTEGDAAAVRLVARVARSLETRGVGINGIMSECSADAAALVARGIGEGAGGYGQATAGLGLDVAMAELRTFGLADAVFGRLFITMEWAACVPSAVDDSIEVPVHVVGSCPAHGHPVIYLATSEDDAFVVIIPCGSTPPPQEAIFSTCADILRAAEPMDTAPYSAVRMTGFTMRQESRTLAISDPAALRVHGVEHLHVAEFGALALSAGRPARGRLCRSPSTHGSVFAVQKPYLLAVFHTDIDDLNVPLAAVLVS